MIHRDEKLPPNKRIGEKGTKEGRPVVKKRRGLAEHSFCRILKNIRISGYRGGSSFLDQHVLYVRMKIPHSPPTEVFPNISL